MPRICSPAKILKEFSVECVFVVKEKLIFPLQQKNLPWEILKDN